MRWYRVQCIHELPHYYADLIDEDYYCPIVVYVKKLHHTRAGWEKPNPKMHYVYDNVYISRNTPLIESEASTGYRDRYEKLSYYVVIDKDEITESDCIDALEMLNKVLKERNESYRFEYDTHMLKETM